MRKKERIKLLEDKIESLQKENRRMKKRIIEMPKLYKEWFENNDQEAEWIQFANHFDYCEHCGWDSSWAFESHSNYTDVCPEAFRQMCEDFIDETGNGNSTRSLIRMLFNAIKDKGEGTMREWVYDYHHQICEGWYAESGEPEPEIDFDKWLKQQKPISGHPLGPIADLLWKYLWTYEQNRECLNTWIVDFWIEDFEKDTGLKVEMMV